MKLILLLACGPYFYDSVLVSAFAPRRSFRNLHLSFSSIPQQSLRARPLFDNNDGVISILMDDDDDDDENVEEEDEEEELEDDPYQKVAASEFSDETDSSSSALTAMNTDLDATMMDWGGALGQLRQRVEDVESGLSKDPSHVLFRIMSSQTPNQVIGQFVSSANPKTVQAMSGAVSSLLGGLTNPNMGVDTLVKATGEKVGSLCFQLQMTGYMFRNAEYVLALKELLNIRGKATLQDYKDAFDRLDKDDSGYLDPSEIEQLFDDVYDGQAPSFETEAFLEFFDANKDGKISWDEFENGLGVAMTTQMEKGGAAMRLLEGDSESDDEDDDVIDLETNVSGTIEIEMEDGKVVEVEAKEYIGNLKAEARALKEALRRENDITPEGIGSEPGLIPNAANGVNGGGSGMDITTYIASRQGDVKSLTEGISPEIVETMKKLVNFVLEGGDGGNGKKELSDQEKAEMEMEIPGSALTQLALWQLVLGYRLRESEVTGDYKQRLKDS